MTKREKIMAGITCMVLAGSIGGVGFVLYSTQNNMDSKVERVEQLEEELSESDAEIDTLRNDLIEITPTSAEAVSTPTETPTPTPQETSEATQPRDEFDDGRCYLGIPGTYVDSSSGRVRAEIMQADYGAPYEYVLIIEGSNGYASKTRWDLVGNWDANSSSVLYTGVRADIEYNPDGSQAKYVSYENQTGSFQFEGSNIFYWTDPGSGNENRGPFEKSVVEYSNEYNVYNEPSDNPEDHTASYDDGHGFYGTWTGNGFEDTFTGGSFNGKTITISPSNKEGYEYRVVISDPYDNGMIGSSIRAFGNYNEEYGIVYNGGKHDNIDLGINWPDESNGVLYLDDDNSLYNYDVSTEEITGPFKKTSDEWD